MSTATMRFLIVLPAIVFVGIEAIRTFVRPVYGQSQYGWISFVLGWLPNFLAAFGCMAFALSIIVLVQQATDKLLAWRLKLAMLSAVTFLTLTGLILHEVFQAGTGLFYDADDVAATIAGVVIGATFCVLSLRMSESRSDTAFH